MDLKMAVTELIKYRKLQEKNRKRITRVKNEILERKQKKLDLMDEQNWALKQENSAEYLRLKYEISVMSDNIEYSQDLLKKIESVDLAEDPKFEKNYESALLIHYKGKLKNLLSEYDKHAKKLTPYLSEAAIACKIFLAVGDASYVENLRKTLEHSAIPKLGDKIECPQWVWPNANLGNSQDQHFWHNGEMPRWPVDIFSDEFINNLSKQIENQQ